MYEFSEILKETRPTAINLAWAVDRVISLVKTNVDSMSSMSEVVDLITKEAIIIHEEDVSLNRRMAEAGSTLFEGKKNIRILTHCNAGALATGGLEQHLVLFVNYMKMDNWNACMLMKHVHYYKVLDSQPLNFTRRVFLLLLKQIIWQPMRCNMD